MDKYAGTIMTIQEVNDNHYKIVEDQTETVRPGGWHWFEEMIDGLYMSCNKTQLTNS